MATVGGEVRCSSPPFEDLISAIGLKASKALAFGYFETLLRLGDASKMREEAARFRGFEALMLAIGNPDTYEEFIEPTVQLLAQQAASLPNHDGSAALLAIFNDDARSSQLTYSFKACLISIFGLSLSGAKVLLDHYQCMDEVQCRILCWLLTWHGCPYLLSEQH